MTYALFEGFLHGYEEILELIAQVSIVTLELIGILIVIIGAFKSIALNATNARKGSLPSCFICPSSLAAMPCRCVHAILDRHWLSESRFGVTCLRVRLPRAMPLTLFCGNGLPRSVSPPMICPLCQRRGHMPQSVSAQ